MQCNLTRFGVSARWVDDGKRLTLEVSLAIAGKADRWGDGGVSFMLHDAKAIELFCTALRGSGPCGVAFDDLSYFVAPQSNGMRIVHLAGSSRHGLNGYDDLVRDWRVVFPGARLADCVDSSLSGLSYGKEGAACISTEELGRIRWLRRSRVHVRFCDSRIRDWWREAVSLGYGSRLRAMLRAEARGARWYSDGQPVFLTIYGDTRPHLREDGVQVPASFYVEVSTPEVRALYIAGKITRPFLSNGGFICHEHGADGKPEYSAHH